MANNSVEEKIFTTEELAEYWKVSYNTVNILLRRGELQGFRVMGAWRIPLSAVKKYEEERTPTKKETLCTAKLVKDKNGNVRIVI